MKLIFFTLLSAIGYVNIASAQYAVDKVKFFEDTSMLKASLALNFQKLMSKKRKEGYKQPALFTCRLSDDFGVSDNMSVEVRGHFRREECYMPPLKLVFKKNTAAAFFKLKSLKLVSSCRVSKFDEQNLLKEYLIYKMYNLICDKSFRVRLLNLTYEDSSGSQKPVTQYAFVIEDIKEVASRNECFVREDQKINMELTDRAQMTKVALFQYMIGNTDWSVMNSHNTRLITANSDSMSHPFVVPYDFDFSGLVNTSYSVPDENLQITHVRDRLYRGFPRTEEEISAELATFSKQKDNIYALVNKCDRLTATTKKDVTSYLDDFFSLLDNPKKVRSIFITNARTD